MNISLIQELVETLQNEMFGKEDLRNLHFYEGAFYVFANQLKNDCLDAALLHSYLDIFLYDLGISDILEEANPTILEKLKKLHSVLAKAGV